MRLSAQSLQYLLPQATCSSDLDISFSNVQSDSRKVTTGDLFVAMNGTICDGHDFAVDAVANGAVALVTERPLPDIAVPQVTVANSPAAYARLCLSAAVGRHCMPVLAGITGTNGKTTTTWMLQSILQAARLTAGLLGTVEVFDGQNRRLATMTTPPADEIANWVKQLLRNNATHGVIEVSSHALCQNRCSALQFAAAVITNITQDHFDYHGSLNAYVAAKSKIAQLLHPDAPLLLNIDDAGCRRVASELAHRASIVTYGINAAEAELSAKVLSKTHRSQRIQLSLAQGDAEVRLRMIGDHNVSNALAAAATAEQLGIRISDIAKGLESLHCVPGRLERIDVGQSFQVLVDYAHTADALSRAIAAIRSFTPGRVICVFGAGGDRDASKRAEMGLAASAADYSIVTSDNPRSEKPSVIVGQVAAGIPHHCQHSTVVDREQAIWQALEMAEPGDVVLLAGKGHESTQEINGRKYPFDDRIVARKLLRDLSTGSASELHPVFALPRSA